MSSLIYFFKKLFYRNLDKVINKFKNYEEINFEKRYLSNNSCADKLKVCTYQTGFNRHYTRFFTSGNTKEYAFCLVEQPNQADIVVFINTINCEVLRRDQRAILFFHEPLAYAHLYQSEINEKFLPKEKLEVVSHLSSISLFINCADGIKFHRSIPYVHFHHMATLEQLSTIDNNKRTKQICSIASGLNGIPGYQNRRIFFENFSKSNSNFDLFGKFSKISITIPSYRGPCIFKWRTVSRYKYSLVIENSDEEYYISEKIFDALICGSMPIYHGSKKIFEIIPKEWFYYLPSLDIAEIDKLNAFISTDAYKAVSENRSEICKIIYENFSFYSALDNLIQNKPLSVSAM